MGILALSADAYHADIVADRPTLSASLARILLSQSPLHAYTAHPRLNPDWQPTVDEKFSLGTVVHQLVLEGTTNVEIVQADSWRTAAAKEQRDDATAAGRVPLLAKDYERVQEIASTVAAQLARFPATPRLFAEGKAEQTIAWEEGGVACRARLDWLRDDYAAVDDLKSTSRSASPDAWTRTLFSLGYEIQAAMYIRAVQTVTGITPEYRLAVVETSPPYALSVIGLAPDAIALANEKLDRAIGIWQRCLETNRWPGYPEQVCYATLPGWAESQWLERDALMEEAA